MQSNKRIEFRPPDGTVPEGTTEGEDFEAVCTFRVKGDGQLCLVMLGDVEMTGYKDKVGDDKPQRMDYGEESRETVGRYRKEMGGEDNG